jgi:hypothetical protein
MIRIVCFFLLWARFAGAAGGDVGGNGGDLVACEGPGGTMSYELLDYFEADHKVPATPFELGEPDWEATRKVQHALDRLRVLDPVRTARYEAEAKSFLSLVDWITQGPGLEHIPDLGEVSIPPNCKVRQVAIRRKTFHPSIKPYLVDERLWLKLDENHKAGLILHEIIYGQMRDLGQKDSINARRYNGVLSSSAFDAMSASDYEALIKPLFVEIQPIAFRADKFDINLLSNQPFSQSLRSLLLYPVKGPLKWTVLESLPKWMVLDPSESMMGVPPASASSPILLTLVVHDGNSGAIAQLRLHVK